MPDWDNYFGNPDYWWDDELGWLAAEPTYTNPERQSAGLAYAITITVLMFGIGFGLVMLLGNFR